MSPSIKGVMHKCFDEHAMTDNQGCVPCNALYVVEVLKTIIWIFKYKNEISSHAVKSLIEINHLLFLCKVELLKF